MIRTVFVYADGRTETRDELVHGDSYQAPNGDYFDSQGLARDAWPEGESYTRDIARVFVQTAPPGAPRRKQ